MNLTENILISNIFIVSSLHLQLLRYTLESPNLKRSSHAQFFGILKKLTFLQEELFWHFFTIQYLDMLVLK